MNDVVRTACPNCDGFGYIEDDETKICPQCSGTGMTWFDDEPNVNNQPIDVPDVLPTDK